jgi:hypothetical protein
MPSPTPPPIPCMATSVRMIRMRLLAPALQGLRCRSTRWQSIAIAFRHRGTCVAIVLHDQKLSLLASPSLSSWMEFPRHWYRSQSSVPGRVSARNTCIWSNTKCLGSDSVVCKQTSWTEFQRGMSTLTGFERLYPAGQGGLPQHWRSIDGQ